MSWDGVNARNFVAGRFQDAAGGRTLENRNPATGAVIGAIPRSGAADVDAAVAAARAAGQGDWGQTSAVDRAALLDRVADLIEARLEAFAAVESQDQGKPVSLARTVDIPRAVANFRFFAGAIRHHEEGAHHMAAALNYTLRSPVGVCALITPWNLPLYLLTWKVAPALAMGNTIVAKPSELTPRTATLLAGVLAEAGLPAGAFNLLHGLGPEVGAPLTAHRDVKLVSFTGGTATGEHVARAAAPSFKKLSLELGGKNPTLVFADADLDAAIEGAARAAFANQGEICLCGSRILVERSVHDRFVAGLVAKAEALRVGDPAAPDTDVGALVSRAHHDKVSGYVALAKEEGGTIAAGGVVPALGGALSGGSFLRPTVVTGLPATCRTATEEIFGPVVTVHPFDTEAEALELANGVRYGLSSSLWTSDLKRAHRVSAALDVGMVWVNTWLLRDLRVPFGGVKDSGVGREGGRWSIEFYSEAKNVCIAL